MLKPTIQNTIYLGMIILGIYIFLVQMWSIHVLWTPVGFVDTWPLYDRLMRFKTGQISLSHYLFDPHVHPHLIVYFLYLMDVTYETGRQLIPHLATLVSIIGLVAIIWYIVYRSSAAQLQINLRSCSFFAGTLILLAGLSEATIIPFQSVVMVTRFIYTLLLAILIFCQFYHNRALHAAALAASIVAASFYASGNIFALQIILIHLLFFRRWRWLLCSTLPLLAYFWMINKFPLVGIEFDIVKTIITEFNFNTGIQLILATSSYYAANLVHPIGMELSYSEIVLITVGFIICTSTVCWALYVLFSLFLKSWRNEKYFKDTEIASCLMAL